MRINSSQDFHMDPLMAKTTAEYINTLMNNVKHDRDLDGFLSDEEFAVLEEARNIAEDVYSAIEDIY